MSTARIETPTEVHYPESDGAPMGETTAHVRAIFALLSAFDLLFRGRHDVFVAADLFLYYEEGNPRAVKAPDVLVAKGVGHPGHRRTYKTWVEGTVPSLIVEVTSAETRHEDAGPKRELYARLGVAEYYLFDPLGEYLTPALQGYRLVGGRYVPIEADAEGGLISVEIEARLSADGPEVRVHPIGAARPIPTPFELADEATEEAERATAEAERATAEAERADALEAEVARLRALVERLGGEGRG